MFVDVERAARAHPSKSGSGSYLSLVTLLVTIRLHDWDPLLGQL